jgi:hypothetical protein
MRMELKDLTALNDFATQFIPGLKIWQENWQGMLCSRKIFPAGTDFTNILKGLPDDMCQVPHWGYCFKGKMKMIYKDGTTEYVVGGDIFCMPAPHNCIAEEDSEFVEFSSAEDMHRQSELAQAIAAKMKK